MRKGLTSLSIGIAALVALVFVVMIGLIATGRDPLTRSLEAYWASLYFPCRSDAFRFDVRGVRVGNGVISFNDEVGFADGTFTDEEGRSLFFYEMEEIISVSKQAESPSLDVCLRDGRCAKTYGPFDCEREK